MNYKLLHEVLNCLEQFDNESIEHKNANIFDFMRWLNRDKNPNPLDYKAPAMEETSESVPLQGGTNAQISQMLILMNKYIRFYLRKAFHDSPLIGADDFGFLATLIFYGDMQKGELIQRNTSEFTSGMEVIKRLEKAELLRSFDDPKDHRAKRVAATDKGIEAFAAVMPAMEQLGKLAMGQLTQDEQHQLFLLLSKLNDFHQPIFHQNKKENWASMVSLFLDKI